MSLIIYKFRTCTVFWYKRRPIQTTLQSTSGECAAVCAFLAHLSLPIQKVSAANKWCGLKPARNAYARSKWLTVKTRMCYRTEPHSKLSHIHSYSIHARQIWEGSRSTKIIRIGQFWRLYGSKLCDFIAYMNKNLWKEQDAEKTGSRTLGGVQAKFVGSTLRACTSPSTISGSLKFSRIRKAQADHDIKFMHWYNIEFALEDRMH